VTPMRAYLQCDIRKAPTPLSERTGLASLFKLRNVVGVGSRLGVGGGWVGVRSSTRRCACLVNPASSLMGGGSKGGVVGMAIRHIVGAGVASMGWVGVWSSMRHWVRLVSLKSPSFGGGSEGGVMSSIERPCIELLGRVAVQPSMSGAVSREQPISQKKSQWGGRTVCETACPRIYAVNCGLYLPQGSGCSSPLPCLCPATCCRRCLSPLDLLDLIEVPGCALS